MDGYQVGAMLIREPDYGFISHSYPAREGEFMDGHQVAAMLIKEPDYGFVSHS